MWVLALACGPAEPRAKLVVVDPERSAVAKAGVLVTAFYVNGDAWAILVDGEGRTRWSRMAPEPQRIARVKAARDGTILLGFNDPDRLGEAGLVTREDVDGNVLSETVAPAFHHDLVELPDGRVGFLGYTFADVEVRGRGVLPLATDHVRIAEEGGGGEVVFDLLADYRVDPYWTCSHMRRGEHVDGYNEWSHVNALVPTDDGGWLLMARYLDAIVALDEDFAVRWQLGGVGDEFGTRAEPLFQHAHASHAFGDRVLVFDNGWNHGGTPAARVVEIAVDPDAGHAEIVWTYEEPEGRGTDFLGDAKRLPNGNTLVSWGELDRITEITPGGDVVWELELDRAVGRVELWDRPLP